MIVILAALSLGLATTVCWACRSPASMFDGRCACFDPTPVCFGPACRNDSDPRTGYQFQSFSLSCSLCQCLGKGKKPTAIPKPYAEADFENMGPHRVIVPRETEKILFVTVATHREPYIELLEQSAKRFGLPLSVLGIGDFFKGLLIDMIKHCS